ncbi:hypothetical protein [Bradyrhizobium sp. NAS80.1]|uniref:hypothetical protein n=1 Tax=Bradyrhizobium sp. NAS80.1 TaxID=1680159 RepID=UPI001FDA55EC|nr:hypothetical protein [Bradyrhizobium sp. NAS80.1]
MALLAGSLAASPASAQNKATTLVYGNTAGPETLDPYVGSSTVDLEVVHHIFEGLVGGGRQLCRQADAGIEG